MAIRRFFGIKPDTIAGGSTVNMPPPVIGTATPSATGGTLAAGTYFYRVTGVNAAGETVGSSEVSAVTTGATSSVTITWTDNPLATGYRIYRGTASGAQTAWQADAGTPFIDTGTVGTAGTVPQISTARNVIPDATDIWPVTGASVDLNVAHLDRNSEITGFRGNPVEEEFRKDPRETIDAFAYQRLVELLFWYALGNADVVTGSAPAAITHKATPMGYAGSGLLPGLVTEVIRDNQIDRMSGGWVNTVTVTFGLDGHGTVQSEIWGLYHNSVSGGSVPVLTRNTRDVKTLKLRDLRAFFNGSPVIVPGVTSFSLTYNNNIVDDSESKWAAGQSVDQVTDGNGVLRRIWYPSQHFLGGSQTITGNIGFSSVQQAEDVKYELAQAEQLVVEVEGGLMATTPAAKEMMRFTVLNAVRSGGGADALAKEGLQKAAYDFMGGIGSTGTDLIVESVSNIATPIV
jgi:hypothetical protein